MLVAATSSHQEQCLRTTSAAFDGGNKDSNHIHERVCVCARASQLEGGRERERERKSLWREGGGAGKGREKLLGLVGKGREEE